MRLSAGSVISQIVFLWSNCVSRAMHPSLLALSLLLTTGELVFSKPLSARYHHDGLPTGSVFSAPVPYSAQILTPVSSTIAVAPVVGVVAPVATSNAIVPVTITQTPIKSVVSFSQPAFQRPEFTVAQQVFHRPVITEVQKVVRRPVITQVEEVVHKPYLTGYSHVIKLPKYKTPVVRNSDYLVHHEPLLSNVFSSKQYYVANMPSSQVLQHLPPQIVQPETAHIQVPIIHQHTGTQTIMHSAAAIPVMSAQSFPVTGSVGNFVGYGQNYG